MLNVVQFSGGKDSTAMLLMMLEKNMPIDDIIFCDTGKEFPELWQELKDMDKRAYNDFKGKGIEYYENKIVSKLRHR